MRPLLLLLLGAHLAYAGSHSFKAFYTVTTGVTNYPEFTTMAVVDGVLINTYDSISKQVVPRTEWMKNSEGPDYWKQQTDIIVGAEQNFKNNLQVAMGRFNQTGGVHTFQFMYGCDLYDDGTKQGYMQYGYDGKDFISFDTRSYAYTAANPQAVITKNKWEQTTADAESRKAYLDNQCIEWLKKYVSYGKDTLERKVSPQVSLLHKDPSSPVTCHATGFYPKEVTISWQKNKQDHDEDVDLGELIINEDGTFQKTSTLHVKPEEWKKNVYECVVEHKSRTIRSILTEDKIRTNYDPSAPVPIGIIVGVVAAVVLLVVIGFVVFKVYQKKKGFKPVNASDDGSNSSAHSDPKA